MPEIDYSDSASPLDRGGDRNDDLGSRRELIKDENDSSE